MANILVVEQDPSVRDQLTDYLGEHAFEVDALESLSSLERPAAPQDIDLMIVNITGEHDDETELVLDLCSTAEVPVIVTSADKVDESDKVAALEVGASDYIVKPFGMRELLARVRVALRASAQRRAQQHMVFTFDNWRLSTRHRRLKDAAGMEVKLTASELNLLIAFLKSPRQILSREQLLLATRIHDQEIFDRSVDVLVLRLRRKLGDDPSSPRYIRTERRAGYIFDAEVEADVVRRRVA
ncbi:Regulatory protein VirG [Agrobacterium tumefaciens str. Kerr 14]|uniref:Regulatory protein VirG n=1 Tax=Agrobacterium tumefaciens str. Kerr 14 TaxID=1183424 RepID=A0A1S7SB63_AGRTU|nr:winged helix-turn-helix domain-containing protein [Agrobacterium tumefaciens]CUX65823.1 Regulatory protein VirG [Agrobacterium tumefaciens str. Kerr 14]